MKTPGGHSEFLERVMRSAVVRHQQRQLGWQVVHQLPTGFCCKALKAFSQNQLVHDIKHKPAKLETIQDLARIDTRSTQVKQHRFYLPVSPDLVITSENEL